VDSYVYGFAMQRPLSRSKDRGAGDVAEPIMELMASGEYRRSWTWRRRTAAAWLRLRRRVRFGLDLILDGIEKRLARV
jgi:hypothetical protein